MRTLIDRWKRNKRPNKKKPAGNINKNTQNFLGMSLMQKQTPLSHKLQDYTFE